MSLLSRVLHRLRRRAPLQPRAFTNPGFTRIAQDKRIEEEIFPDYLAAQYYPVRVGEVFVNRYQVVGKLGFGAHSTVWLARDLNQHGHVALKVFIYSQALGGHVNNEIAMYKRMEQRASSHPGRGAVRTLLDSFRVNGPDGEHLCLVHPPLWESVANAVRRCLPPRLPTSGLRFVLKDLFLALEYLHKECQIVHTDIKADNIMFSIPDLSVLADFEEEEIRNPCPRKEIDGRVIYTSRAIGSLGKIGPPVLCDFGSAVFGEEEHLECVQPNAYRSPEVTLKASWDYKIDIWSVGCMIWDIYEGRQLFRGIDPEHHAYRRRAHLAEIIALLGPPPTDLLARGNLTSKFFSQEGQFTAGINLPTPVALEAIETNLTGEDKRRFLEFMWKMLHWDPRQRSSPGELYQDPWLQEQNQ
ncbi:kinase domain protein [Nemania serpens]|nr:kinase domain protein [Nemania serpens]